MGVTFAIVPSEADIQTVLRAFLLRVLGSGVEIVTGQLNRVAELYGSNFVTMIPVRRPRLSTNVDDYVDCEFVGAIADDVLAVSAVHFGAIAAGSPVFGAGVAAGTKIASQIDPTSWRVTPAGQTVASELMAAGVVGLSQPADLVMQLDVHGPAAADNAVLVSTAFRDLFAADFFSALRNDVAPLHADDPIQLPFSNDQQQVENRWKIDAHLQVNARLEIPQEFANTVVIDRKPVDAIYPA
jgi:hypothetical protein